MLFSMYFLCTFFVTILFMVLLGIREPHVLDVSSRSIRRILNVINLRYRVLQSVRNKISVCSRCTGILLRSGALWYVEKVINIFLTNHSLSLLWTTTREIMFPCEIDQRLGKLQKNICTATMYTKNMQCKRIYYSHCIFIANLLRYK